MRRVTNRLVSLGRYAFVIAACAAAALPLYWMIHEAVQPSGMRFEFPPSLLPRGLTVDGVRDALTGHDTPRWLLNTLLVSSTAAGATLLVAVWGAYALSRFKGRAMEASAFLVLATQFMPPVVLMIPIYQIFLGIGLGDSLLGLSAAYVVFTLPVTIWMLKSVFDFIPIELEEAAQIDGCNIMQGIWHVLLPLALPGIVAAGIFSFLESWGEYLFAQVLITSSDNWVGSIGVASLLGEYGPPWGELMAMTAVFTIPPVILFLVIQRYYIAALEGAVKG